MKCSRRVSSVSKLHQSIWDSGIIFIALLPLFLEVMAGKQELQKVIQGNGHFTKQLYNVLAQKPGNVCFSPISAHAVLSMAYQGADGTTRAAFGKILGMSNQLEAAVGYQDVIKHLNNVSDVQLLMANKVYVMEGYALKPAFKEVTEKKFFSEVQSLNFKQSTASANTINQWVEDKTQEKIKDLISPDILDESTRLILVNAIYFKGTWASKFNKELTQKETFYLNDNDTIEVEMMNTKGKYFYKEDETLDAKVLELPYSNSDVSLLVILPNKKNGIADLEKKLAETDLTKITENMFKPEVVVKLPKFKIETTIDLNEPLKKIGLGEIFSSKANFSEMLESPEQLVVSKVIQKAFIEVNEEGTEAAAASAAIRTRRSVNTPNTFFVDKPCVYALICQNQGEPFKNVLFYGKIVKPSPFETHYEMHNEL
ncbi:serine protease inhibitor 3/4-like isoform X4 [Euwallacea fornicatus]|uniref:serine protease inhibitor 3/4-like isoform X4 n=1 Tax=Euwallacea fornicatus TaxID=995702 RepID=UPI0033904713